MPDQNDLKAPVLALAETIKRNFASPEYIPGCAVKSVTDINEYTTDNGWVEVIAGQHNQQRTRYRGFPAGLAVDDEVDVMHFPDRKTFEIQGSGGTVATGLDAVKVSRIWESDGGTIALHADAEGNIGIGTALGVTDGLLTLSKSAVGHFITISGDNIDSIIEVTATNKPSANTHILRFIPTIDPQVSPIPNVFGVNSNPNIGGATSNNISALNLVNANYSLEDSYNGTINTVRRIRVPNASDNSSGSPTVTHDYAIFVNELTLAINNYGLYTLGATRSYLGAASANQTPAAKLHLRQGETGESIPVLHLDQTDVSEPIIEYDTTIGVGNSIEAVGNKLLRITHFIKEKIPGGLIRYSPVGTISETGPPNFKSQTVTTQGLGANPDIFAFGFYQFSTADSNLTQASTTQTFGGANASFAAHASIVAGGAGSVDTGVIGLRVNGTSIDDQGNRTTSDTETIIADITAVSLDEYAESAKKWLGQITFELFTVSGSPTTFSLDFNYGISKYDDYGNNDFTLTDIEAVGFGGANDTGFDIKLLHHRSTGWTYAATGFSPITAANTIVSLVGDHSTENKVILRQHFSWKRDNLSTVINGANGEGFLILISSSANNAVEYLNLHTGVIFNV